MVRYNADVNDDDLEKLYSFEIANLNNAKDENANANEEEEESKEKSTSLFHPLLSLCT